MKETEEHTIKEKAEERRETIAMLDRQAEVRRAATAEPDQPARHTIDLGFLKPDAAAAVALALDGKTLMDFRVVTGIPTSLGCRKVKIQTDYIAEPGEIAAYALTYMAEALAEQMAASRA